MVCAQRRVQSNTVRVLWLVRMLHLSSTAERYPVKVLAVMSIVLGFTLYNRPNTRRAAIARRHSELPNILR